MNQYKLLEPIIFRLHKDELSLRSIRAKLLEMHPDKTIPSIMTIQRIIQKQGQVLSRFEHRDKDKVLLEVNEGFDKLVNEVLKARDSVFMRANVTYDNKRILIREHKEVFNELENLRNDSIILIDKYHDMKRWLIMDFNREVIMPLIKKHRSISKDYNKLMNAFIDRH